MAVSQRYVDENGKTHIIYSETETAENIENYASNQGYKKPEYNVTKEAFEAEQSALISDIKQQARDWARKTPDQKRKEANSKYADTILKVGSDAAKEKVIRDRYQVVEDRYQEALQSAKDSKPSLLSTDNREQKAYEESWEKAHEAKAERDKAAEELRVYLAQSRREQEQIDFESDLAKIKEMPEADRKDLETYVALLDSEFYNSNAWVGMDNVPMPSQIPYQRLSEKYGESTVQRLAAVYREDATAELNQKASEAGFEQGRKAGLWTLPFRTAVSYASRSAGALDAARDVSMPSARPSGGNANLLGNVGQSWVQGVDAGVTEDMNPFGAGVYNVGTGVLDLGMQVLQTAVNGPASAKAVMAMGGFAEGYQTALSNGATQEKAVLMGAGQAVIEYAAEAIPLERMLNVAKEGYKPFMELLSNAVAQGGVEMTSELLGAVATDMFEAVHLQENSTRKRDIADYVQNGASYEEAVKQVNTEKARELKQTALVSFFTGGFAAGVEGTIENINAKIAETAENPANTLSDNAKRYMQAEQGVLPEQAQQPAQQPNVPNVEQQPAQQETVEQITDRAAEMLKNPEPTIDERVSKPQTDEELQRILDIGNGVEPVNKGDNLEDSSITMEKDMQDYPYNTQETIQGYQEAVDKNVVDFVDRVKNGTAYKGEKISVGNVNDRMSSDIERLTGVKNKSGNQIILNTDAIQHIENRHGVSGLHDKTMSNIEDIGRINYVLQNYDSAFTDGKPVKGFRNKDGSNAKSVVFQKKINGTYFVVEAVPDTDSTWIVSAYMNKNGVSQVSDANAPKTTSETRPGTPQEVSQVSNAEASNRNTKSGLASTPESRIPNQEQNVNRAVQRSRLDDARQQEIPVTDDLGKRVSETAGNLYTSGYTNDEVAAEIKKLAQDGDLGFDVKPNGDAVQSALEEIQRETLPHVAKRIGETVKGGKISSDDIATGITAYMIAVKSGETQMAADLAVDLTAMGNMAGRSLQMFRLLREMTPEGQYLTAQKTIQRSVDAINANRREKKKANVIYSDDLKVYYEDAARGVMEAEAELDSLRQNKADKAAIVAAQKEVAKAQEEVEGVYNAMIKVAASQIDATGMEIWHAWRNMSMLHNAMTTIRNVGGNLAMKPVWWVKKAIASAIEGVAIKDKSKRTTALVGFTGDDKALRDFAKQDVQSKRVQRWLETGKYEDTGASGLLANERQIFKHKTLEKARKATGFALNNDKFGDMAFKNSEYVSSFAGFLKAQGYTGADVKNGTVPDSVLENARNHSVEQALVATFNDSNRISKLVSRRFSEDEVSGIVLNAFIDANLTYRKVPANIAARIYDLSPAGIAGAVMDYKSGKINQNQLIDRVSRGATGITGAILGGLLASGICGVRLRAGNVSDEEKRAGSKTYSFEWEDEDGKIHSNKLAWLGASFVPFFIGAAVYEAFSDIADGDGDWLESFFDASGGVFEPIIEMSMLEGLKRTLDTASDLFNDEVSPVEAFLNATINYFLQAVPTAGRAIENTVLPNEMMSYTDAETGAGRALQYGLSRIPGIGVLTGTRIEKRDEWGNPISKGTIAQRAANAFLNPFDSSVDKSTPVEQEIAAINAEAPDAIKLSDPQKKISYVDDLGNKQERRLSADEYTQYAEVFGKTREQLMTKEMEADGWADYSVEQKADAFNNAQTTAHETARASIIGMDGFSDAANAKISAIAKETGNNSIYYTKPTNSISYTDKTGAQQKRKFTEEEYAKFSETQKNTYSSTVDSILNNQTFQKLSPENQLQALQYAKEYATEAAKKAALPDYYVKPENWTEDVKGSAAKFIAEKVETEVFKRAVDSWADDIIRGHNSEQSNDALQKMFDDYLKMPASTKEHVLDEVDGDAKKYLLARNDKISHDDAVTGIAAVKRVAGTGAINKDTGKPTVTDYDRYGAIGDADDLSDDTKIALMKVYMTDFDPNAKTKDYSELKLDYVISKGFSPSDYDDLYRTQASESKWKPAAIAVQKAYGISYNEAYEIVKIFKQFTSSDYAKTVLH